MPIQRPSLLEVAVGTTFFVLAGCGTSARGVKVGDSGSSTGGSDAASDAVSSTDGDDAATGADATATRDAADDSAAEPSDASSTPADGADATDGGGPKGLLADGHWTIFGITDDDWIAAVNGPASSSGAEPPVSMVDPHSLTVKLLGDTRVDVQGKLVFAWSMGLGPLATWTSAAGRSVVSTLATTQLGNMLAAPDGSRIAFIDGTTTASLTIANPDGSSKLVATSLYAGCATLMRYSGKYIVVSYCPGKGGFDVGAFDVTTGTQTAIVANAWLADVDAAGTVALTIGMDGSANVMPLAGGASKKIGTAIGTGKFLPDGATLLVLTTAKDLQRVPMSGGSPTTIVSGVSDFRLSPDGKFAAYTTGDLTSLHNLKVISTAGAGAPRDVGASFADFGAFSADGTTFVFRDATSGSYTGVLSSMKLADGTITKIATGVGGYGLAGTKLVFDQPVSTALAAPLDVSTVGLGASATPVSLVKGVTQYRINHAGDHVGYASETPSPGLYWIGL